MTRSLDSYRSARHLIVDTDAHRIPSAPRPARLGCAVAGCPESRGDDGPFCVTHQARYERWRSKLRLAPVAEAATASVGAYTLTDQPLEHDTRIYTIDRDGIIIRQLALLEGRLLWINHTAVRNADEARIMADALHRAADQMEQA